jgi:exonuclease III
MRALLHTWHVQLRLHIVCVQELKLHTEDRRAVELTLATAAADLGIPGYHVYWGCNEDAASGGVAILVRSDLLDSGQLSVIGGRKGTKADPDGRLMSMRCKWGGHTLLLACAYLPSGDAPGQRSMVDERLRPLVSASSKDAIMLMGDFNFTADWAADRTRPFPV